MIHKLHLLLYSENKAGYTNRHRRVRLGRGGNVGGRGGRRYCIHDNISFMWLGRSSEAKTARKCWKINSVTDRRTDGPTDRRTDRPSYRDARTHLKRMKLMKKKKKREKKEKVARGRTVDNLGLICILPRRRKSVVNVVHDSWSPRVSQTLLGPNKEIILKSNSVLFFFMAQVVQLKCCRQKRGH